MTESSWHEGSKRWREPGAKTAAIFHVINELPDAKSAGRGKWGARRKAFTTILKLVSSFYFFEFRADLGAGGKGGEIMLKAR